MQSEEVMVLAPVKVKKCTILKGLPHICISKAFEMALDTETQWYLSFLAINTYTNETKKICNVWSSQQLDARHPLLQLANTKCN